MPLPRLLLRADGNARLGLGHVIRSLALAEEVAPLFREIVLLTQAPAEAVRQLAHAARATVQPLPEQAIDNEVALMQTLVQPGDILVLDGHGFGLNYQAAMLAVGCRLVLIDDLHQHPVLAHLVINRGPAVQATDYVAQPHTRFCLGSAFSLLRRPFRELARLPWSAPTVISSALLCFGGADPLGLTHQTLRTLLSLPQIKHVGVVLGSAFTAEAALHELTAQFPAKQVDFHRDVPAAELAALLLGHEAAVVPASTVLLEALLLGCAAVTGYYAADQQALAEYVAAHQQAFSVGNFARHTPETLRAALAQGLDFHQNNLRQPYVKHLQTETLKSEFQRLTELDS